MNLWLRLVLAGITSLVFSIIGLILGACVSYMLPGAYGSSLAVYLGLNEDMFNLASGYAVAGWQAGLIVGAIIGFFATKDVKLRITTDDPRGG